MKLTFEKDSLTLAEKGDWKLVVYAKRCISFLSKDGDEIKTLSCCASEREDGALTDEAILLDKLGDLYMEKVQESQWRPIDTVEKNSLYIWLADSTNMRIGFWALDTVEGSGFWADLAKAESTGPRGLHFKPTHWQLLPKPPTV